MEESGGSLGGSWAPLVGIWGGLGALLGGLETVLGRHGCFGSFLGPAGPCDAFVLGVQRGAKIRPKSNPKRSKIDDQNEDEKKKF